MKRLLLTLPLLFPTALSSQELHTFSNGEVADAEKINENFVDVDQRLRAIEDALQSVPFWGMFSHSCTGRHGFLHRSSSTTYGSN